MFKRKLQPMTIKHKVVSIVMLVCVPLLLLAGTGFVVWEWVYHSNLAEENLITRARMIANNSNGYIAMGDTKSIERTLNAFSTEPSIVFSCVLDEDGKVLVTYYRSDLDKRVELSELHQKGQGFSGGFLTVFQHIMHHGQIIGTVCLRSDIQPLYTMLKHDTIVFITLLLFTSFTVCLVLLQVQKTISEPILSLTQTAKIISERKDHSIRLPNQSDDEIGILADSFNGILEQIQQDESTLVDTNKQLDEKVKEHIGELKVTNELLAKEIVERKQTEKKLVETKNHLQLMLRSSPAVIYHCEISKKFEAKFISENVFKQFGYTAEEFLSDPKCWVDNIHPEDREWVLEGLSDITEKDGHSHEYRFRHKNGKYRWMLDECNVIYDEIGNPVEIVGYMVDITNRKEVEKALEESERRYRTLLRNIPQKIFYKDSNSVYVLCNDSYAEDLHIRHEQVKGKTDYDFYPKELADKYKNDDKRIMRTGKPEEIEEKYIQGGREVTVHTCKTPIRDENGNITGIFGVFWDTAQIKKAEQDLAEPKGERKITVQS